MQALFKCPRGVPSRLLLKCPTFLVGVCIAPAHRLLRAVGWLKRNLTPGMLAGGVVSVAGSAAAGMAYLTHRPEASKHSPLSVCVTLLLDCTPSAQLRSIYADVWLTPTQHAEGAYFRCRDKHARKHKRSGATHGRCEAASVQAQGRLLPNVGTCVGP